MNKFSSLIFVSLGLLTSATGHAEIGIQTLLTCYNPVQNIKAEVQSLPALDIAKPKSIKVIGIEVGGNARPSVVVDEEKKVGQFQHYNGATGRLVIKDGPTDQRDAEISIQGVGNNIKLSCNPPFQSFCGLAVVNETSGTPVWNLLIPNLYYPAKEFPKMVKAYELAEAKPKVLDVLKKDKTFCVSGTFAGTKNSMTISVENVVNKTAIP
ncbi:MAG: hypothetical protein K2X47_09400 [Bdellovibrionales bacterium]|nr:hypothetical protein [Bdellovibrionales bacterium]